MNYFKKFSKLKQKSKDKKISITPVLLGVLGVFVLCIGSSYAYLTNVNQSESTTIISAGSLQLSFINGDNNLSILNAVPMPDDKALVEAEEYTFNIKNTGTIAAYYELKFNNVCSTENPITIKGNQVTPDQCIPTEYIRVAIKKGVGDYTIKNMADTNTILLDTDMIHSKTTTEEYSIKMWLDINTPNTYNIKNQNIVAAGNLSLYAEQRNIKKLTANCLKYEEGYFDDDINSPGMIITDYTCNYTDIEIPDKIYEEKKAYTYTVDREKMYEDYMNTYVEDYIEYYGYETWEDYINALVEAGTITQEVADETTAYLKQEMDEIADRLEAGITEEEREELFSLLDELGVSNDISNEKITITRKEIKIDYISSYAFSNKKLNSVIIGEGIKGIDEDSFSNNELNDVTILNDNMIILYGAFTKIKYLKDSNGNFPNQCFKPDENGKIFGYSQQFPCVGIKNIIIPESINGVNITSIENILNIDTIDFSRATYLSNVSNIEVKVLDLSNNTQITSIGVSAFSNNQISTLNIPNSVTSIGANAFSNNQISTLNIPSSVTSIGINAFSNNQISTLNIPNSVTSIGANAFQNNQISTLNIPNSVTAIENYTFQNNQISTLNIPNSVTSIGANAFQNNQISTLNIPSSVTSIGDYAFQNNQISTLNIPNVTWIRAYAFQNNQISTLNIPSSVTSIERYAFANNQLTNIVLPTSVTSLGIDAFAGNSYDIEDSNGNFPDSCFNSYSSNTIKGYNCSGAKTLIIPNKIKYYPINTWYSVPEKVDAETIIVPSNITTITASMTSFRKDGTNNKNLTKIINNTGKAFDWTRLITGTAATAFETGTVTSPYGDVIITKD